MNQGCGPITVEVTKGFWKNQEEMGNGENGITYLLVAPRLVDSNVSTPSLVEKKVPHLGHLTMVSFDMGTHPKEKQMTIEIIMNIFIFVFICSPR